MIQYIRLPVTIWWFYGLSGSGKTTLASAVAAHLKANGQPVVILDGDRLRAGMCSDLDYTVEGRLENVRRAAELAKLLAEQGFFVLVSLMSPLERMRQLARNIIGDSHFQAIYLRCDYITCSKRDSKGVYARVQNGELIDFPGFDLRFEEPTTADLILDTDETSIEACVQLLLKG